MALLVLLNGPPASGKSTIARCFVDARPMSLSLDIDIVRSMLGDWLNAPDDSGLAARALALTMAERHMADGHDVIVPQFLGRPDFIEQLALVADRAGASFIETALWLDRETAIAAFEERRARPSDQTHHDAHALVEQSTHADPIGQMYDRFAQLVESRPATRRVDVARGDVERTLKRFRNALDLSE